MVNDGCLSKLLSPIPEIRNTDTQKGWRARTGEYAPARRAGVGGGLRQLVLFYSNNRFNSLTMASGLYRPSGCVTNPMGTRFHYRQREIANTNLISKAEPWMGKNGCSFRIKKEKAAGAVLGKEKRPC